MEIDEIAFGRAVEAAHYAQGLDDFGVANEYEIAEATELARAIIVAYLSGVEGRCDR